MSMSIPMKKNKFLLLLSLFVLLAGCANNQEEPKNPEGTQAPVTKSHVTKFSLNNIDYTLPLTYQKLEADGWIVNTEIDEEIEPNKYVSKKFLRNGPHIIEVIFYNPTDKKIAMKDAWIAQIGSENREFGGDIPSDLTVEGEINLNSSLDDVLNHFGEHKLEKSAVYDTYTFEHDKSAKTVIKYNPEEASIRWLIITDFKEWFDKLKS